jgi:hypothetical protein
LPCDFCACFSNHYNFLLVSGRNQRIDLMIDDLKIFAGSFWYIPFSIKSVLTIYRDVDFWAFACSRGVVGGCVLQRQSSHDIARVTAKRGLENISSAVFC